VTRAEHTAEAWDAEAPAFDEAPDHGLRDPAVRAAWRSLLLEHLPPAPARVADLGCGTGTLSVLLAEEGYWVDGLDLSPEMVRRAEEKAASTPDLSVTFRVGDASEPELIDGTYDVVLSRHVLWALPDRAAGLERWVRLLAPGGRLLLVEGSWSTGGGLTADQTRSLVEGAGRSCTVLPLPEPEYWGRTIEDERYLVHSPD
jgi:ubiquinone/menaquinone biosynthesis C-methylase UbiE